MAAVGRLARTRAPVVRLGAELLQAVIDITGASQEAAAKALAAHNHVQERAIAALLGINDEDPPPAAPAKEGKPTGIARKKRRTEVVMEYKGEGPSQPPPAKKQKPKPTINPKAASNPSAASKPTADKKPKAAKGVKPSVQPAVEPSAKPSRASPKAARQSVVAEKKKFAAKPSKPKPEAATKPTFKPKPAIKPTPEEPAADTKQSVAKKQPEASKEPAPKRVAEAAAKKASPKRNAHAAAKPKASIAKSGGKNTAKKTSAAIPRTAKKRSPTAAASVAPTPGPADAAAEAEFEAQLAAVLAQSQETARIERQSRRIDPSDDKTLAELGNAKLLRELAFDAPGDKVAYLPTATAAAAGPGSGRKKNSAGLGSGRKKRSAAAAAASPPLAVDADESESADEDNDVDDGPLVSAMYEPGSSQHTEAIARAGSQTSPEIMKKVREAAAAAAAEASDASGNSDSDLAPAASPSQPQQVSEKPEDEVSVPVLNEVDAMRSPEFQGSEDANAERDLLSQDGAAAAVSGSGGRQSARRARKPAPDVEKLMAMGFDRQSCEDALRKGRRPQCPP